MLGLLTSLLLACPPVTQRVMVFNIEYGGDLVDFAKTVEAIERAAPDVVLIEEAWGNVPRLAQALGFSEHNLRHQVLSRHPLLDPQEGEGRYLYVEPTPGCVFALANVHLPSDPSVADVLRGGKGVEAAMEVERRSRLRALEPTLASLRELLAAGMPVLLGGDFNARSHLDDPNDWPTSRAVAAAGLKDAWREVYPDAKIHPGFTWWASRPRVPGWNPRPDAPQVRIDQLHAGGAVRVVDARIVGEAGKKSVDIDIAPWPSDHRAVLVTLEMTPASVPTLVTAWPPRVTRGDELRARARRFAPGFRVALVTTADHAAPPVLSRDAAADVVFATADLVAGAYEVVLLDGSGQLRSAAPVYVMAADGRPSVSVGSPLKSGQAIEARWAGAPGNRWDWVGVYAEGTDPERRQPLLWRHTRAAVVGSVSLDRTAEGDGWPLRPGAYRLYLCEDDGYRALASAAFIVEP